MYGTNHAIQIPPSPTFSSDTEPESPTSYPSKFVQDNPDSDWDGDLEVPSSCLEELELHLPELVRFYIYCKLAVLTLSSSVFTNSPY